MHVLYRIFIFVTFICLSTSVSAEVTETTDPLFNGDEILQMTITAPLTTLVRERPK
ncbi:MAG: hypothetical protein ACI9BW_003508, partial [Gammaproteobacteria bacterium]